MPSLNYIRPLYKALSLLGCAFVILACGYLPTPAPTPVPGAVETIVVGTAAAAQTQTVIGLPASTETPTFTIQPTETGVPTQTSTPTHTPTATIIFIIPTATFSPTATSLPTATGLVDPDSAGTICKLVDKEPNDPTLSPGETFTMSWTVKNVGGDIWGDGEVDFMYSKGKDMHSKDIYDLPESVPHAESITLEVPMVAPNTIGTYTTTWELVFKKEPLCTLSVTVTVK